MIVRPAVLYLALSLSVCATAQTTGSRLPGASSAMVGFAGVYEEGNMSSRPSDEAVALGRTFAACLIAKRRESVLRYLSATSAAERESSLRVVNSAMVGCLGSGRKELVVASSTLEGALAEALILRGEAPLVKSSALVTERPIWFSDIPAQRVVQEMSVCVADRAPGEAMTLVRSPPNSTQEARAFSNITPLIGPCLIRGATLQANRASIRFALASALYHGAPDPNSQSTAAAVERK